MFNCQLLRAEFHSETSMDDDDSLMTFTVKWINQSVQQTFFEHMNEIKTGWLLFLTQMRTNEKALY